MAKFAANLLAFIGSCQTYVYVLVAGALLVIGAMFVYPSHDSKEAAKKALPWVFVGCALALGAVVIAKNVSSSMAF